jgi:hypothetical protein
LKDLLDTPTVTITADRQSPKNACQLHVTEVSHLDQLTDMHAATHEAGFRTVRSSATGSDTMILTLELQSGVGIGEGHLVSLANAVTNSRMQLLQ